MHTKHLGGTKKKLEDVVFKSYIFLAYINNLIKIHFIFCNQFSFLLWRISGILEVTLTVQTYTPGSPVLSMVNY